LFDSLVELGDGVRDLLLARRMRRQLELALHFGASQAARLELSESLGVTTFGGLSCFLFFLFALFHPLGEAGFRVDESFSGVTHATDYTDLVVRFAKNGVRSAVAAVNLLRGGLFGS